MKKIISMTVAAMLLSLSAFADSTSVTPSSGVTKEESISTESSTQTLPSGDTVHQETRKTKSSEREAQEDTSMMDSSPNLNRKSGATTEPLEDKDQN